MAIAKCSGSRRHWSIQRLAEEWPVFSIVRHLDPLHREVWVEIMNVPPFGQNPFRYAPDFYAEFQRLERACLHDGIVGILVEVEATNQPMMVMTPSFGFTLAGPRGSLFVWIRRLPAEPLLPWRHAWRRIREALHAD